MKKRNEYLTEDIIILDLDKDLTIRLKDNDINIIEDIWLKNKNNLKTLGLTDKEIKLISIKMQLLGLDLNKKIY